MATMGMLIRFNEGFLMNLLSKALEKWPVRFLNDLIYLIQNFGGTLVIIFYSHFISRTSIRPFISDFSPSFHCANFHRLLSSGYFSDRNIRLVMQSEMSCNNSKFIMLNFYLNGYSYFKIFSPL